jgi:hypothetical protein
LQVMHLWSLRRHDPDQVRWVGLRLSARQRRTPREIAAQYVVRVRAQGKAALPVTLVFAGLCVASGAVR